jgi:hypothetical protein
MHVYEPDTSVGGPEWVVHLGFGGRAELALTTTRMTGGARNYKRTLNTERLCQVESFALAFSHL